MKKQTELTYINDQQFVNDAATMLIESHLRWSNSTDNLPSWDHDNVRGDMLLAHREAHYTKEEWRAMDELRRAEARLEVLPLYDEAALLADRKWMAAMTLLGIEQ